MRNSAVLTYRSKPAKVSGLRSAVRILMAGAAAIPSIRTSRMDFILGWRIVLRYGRAAGDKLRRYRTGYPATRRRRRAEAGSDSPWPGTGSMWTRRQWQFQG